MCVLAFGVLAAPKERAGWNQVLLKEVFRLYLFFIASRLLGIPQAQLGIRLDNSLGGSFLGCNEPKPPPLFLSRSPLSGTAAPGRQLGPVAKGGAAGDHARQDGGASEARPGQGGTLCREWRYPPKACPMPLPSLPMHAASSAWNIL